MGYIEASTQHTAETKWYFRTTNACIGATLRRIGQPFCCIGQAVSRLGQPLRCLGDALRHVGAVVCYIDCLLRQLGRPNCFYKSASKHHLTRPTHRNIASALSSDAPKFHLTAPVWLFANYLFDIGAKSGYFATSFCKVDSPTF